MAAASTRQRFDAADQLGDDLSSTYQNPACTVKRLGKLLQQRTQRVVQKGTYRRDELLAEVRRLAMKGGPSTQGGQA